MSVPFVLARLIPFPSLRLLRPSSSRIAPLPASPSSRSFAPFSRVDGRGAISCLPCISPSISDDYAHACSMSYEAGGDDG